MKMGGVATGKATVINYFWFRDRKQNALMNFIFASDFQQMPSVWKQQHLKDLEDNNSQSSKLIVQSHDLIYAIRSLCMSKKNKQL